MGRLRGDDAGDGFVEVELVEHDASGASHPEGHGSRRDVTDGPAEEPSHARRGGGVPRRAWVALVAVLVLVVAANVVEDRRAAARDAEVAAVPGLVDSLADPLTEAWRSTAPGTLVATDDVVLLQRVHGPSLLEAIDPHSGEVLWSAQGAADELRFCQPWGVSGVRGAAQDVDAVLCQVERADAWESDDATTVLERLDVRSGELTGSVELPHPILVHHEVDEHLVAAWLDDDGRPTAVRVDPVTGTEVWRVSGEPWAAATDATWASVDDRVLALGHGDGDGDGPSFAVDLASGAPAEPTADGVPFEPEGFETASGDTVRLRQGDEGTPITTVEDGSGTVLLEADGWPAFASVDDGSAAEVILLHDPSGSLVAHHLGSGEVAWAEGSSRSVHDVLRLRGGLVMGVGDEVRMVDARTGELRWAVTDVAPAGVVSDGHRVLVARTDEVGGLSVHDLEDGREVWRDATVTEVERLEPGGGGVLVHGVEGLRALR